MPLTVRSPHNHQPVKVRDQDIGRAIRDADNHIFYVVPFSDGSGYYGAVTRKGSPKDEERYRNQTQRVASGEIAVKAQQAAHDATGRKRSRAGRRLVVLLLVLLLLAGGLVAVSVIAPGTLPAIDKLIPRDLIPAPQTQSPEPSALFMRPDTGALPPHAAIRLVDNRLAKPTRDADLSTFERTPEGLYFRNEVYAEGQVPRPGDFVRIHFATYSPSGKRLDRSRPGPPVGFTFWTGQSIRAWDLGIAGMAVGEQRTVLAPLSLVNPARSKNRSPPREQRFRHAPVRA